MQIGAKTANHPESVVVEFDMPSNLDETVARFGAEAVYNAAVDSFTIALQALIRRNIDKPLAEVQAAVSQYVPGTRTRGVAKSPVEKATDLLKQLTPEQRKAILHQLRQAA